MLHRMHVAWILLSNKREINFPLDIQECSKTTQLHINNFLDLLKCTLFVKNRFTISKTVPMNDNHVNIIDNR
jgi:hypothetical protein